MEKPPAVAAMVVAMALAGHLLAGTAPAAAKPLGVVELFTSQGCNSCPPADAAFEVLAQQGDVIALAYHVDYWDYLGWADTLASRRNTERQHAYAKSFGSLQVYTPQAVLNGRAGVSGANGPAIRQKLERLAGAGEGMAVEVSARTDGETIVVETGAASGPVEARLLLVYFDRLRSVAIRRGENAGKVIAYRNAVKAVHPAAIWRGEKMRFELPRQAEGPCVALLQGIGPDGTLGPILGAALLER